MRLLSWTLVPLCWGILIFILGFNAAIMGAVFILRWEKNRDKEENNPLLEIVCSKVVLGPTAL